MRGRPVALPPTEIETSYTEHQILILEKSIYLRMPSRGIARHGLAMR